MCDVIVASTAKRKFGLIKLIYGKSVKRIKSHNELATMIDNVKYFEKLENNNDDDKTRIIIFNDLIIFVIVFILSSIKAEK